MITLAAWAAITVAGGVVDGVMQAATALVRKISGQSGEHPQ